MKVIKADEFQYVITSDNKIVSLFRKPNLACVESNLNKGKSNHLKDYKKHYMSRDYIFGKVSERYPISSIKLEKVVYPKQLKIGLNSLIFADKEKNKESIPLELLENASNLFIIDGERLDSPINLEHSQQKQKAKCFNKLSDRENNLNSEPLKMSLKFKDLYGSNNILTTNSGDFKKENLKYNSLKDVGDFNNGKLSDDVLLLSSANREITQNVLISDSKSFNKNIINSKEIKKNIKIGPFKNVKENRLHNSVSNFK